MPLLLYRYIVGDLLKVFALTATVLVTVIAFGATVKPLSSDGLLTLGDTMKYLMLVVVPMLQFALPFAAGFASTLVMHRMTSDNEIVAAAASGISYRRILAPLFAMGLTLTLIMVLLTQWAIPRFWGIMEQIVTADVTRLFEASIESGRPFQIGNLQIFADNMWVVANPTDTQADTRLILSRVVAAEVNSAGRIATDVTANQAVVDVHRLDGQTYLRLVLTDTVAFDGSPGQLARVPQLEPEQAIVIPSVFRDEMRTMTRGQLLRLRANPDLHGRVETDRLALAEAIRNSQLWSNVEEQLAQDGSLTLSQSGPTLRRYVVHATSVANGRFRSTTDTVEVRRYEGEALVQSIVAREAQLHRVGSPSFSLPTFELELLDTVVTDYRDGATTNRRERYADQNLVLQDFQALNLPDLSSAQLLAYVSGIDRPTAPVRRAAQRLRQRLIDVDNEITARSLHRYTQSITVLLLLLIGATLAMYLRGAMPLVVYIWAFAPSILALILISGGDKMIRDGGMISGVAVMWSGNIALMVMLSITYLRLARN